MKKKIYLLMVAILMMCNIGGCSGNPDIPDKTSKRMYDIGVQVLNCADNYLDDEISEDSAGRKMQRLYENSEHIWENSDEKNTNDRNIRDAIENITNEGKYYNITKSGVEGHRDELAKALGMETRFEKEEIGTTEPKEEMETIEPEEPQPSTEDASVLNDFETNYLKQLTVLQLPVMNGIGTEQIGTYACVKAKKELAKQISEQEYIDFCNDTVRDSGYNWFSIDFGDGTGIVFAGSIPETGQYGEIDATRCITKTITYIGINPDNTITLTDASTYY